MNRFIDRNAYFKHNKNEKGTDTPQKGGEAGLWNGIKELDIIDGELTILNSLHNYLEKASAGLHDRFTDMIMRRVYGKVTPTNGDRKLDYRYGLYKDGFY